MNSFINRFAKKATSFSNQEIEYLYNLFVSFLDACSDIPRETFATKKGDFNSALFDSIFAVIADEPRQHGVLVCGKLDAEKVGALKADNYFEEAITHSTSHSKAVATRLAKAREYLK